jgi:alpha-galactosidase
MLKTETLRWGHTALTLEIATEGTEGIDGRAGMVGVVRLTDQAVTSPSATTVAPAATDRVPLVHLLTVGTGRRLSHAAQVDSLVGSRWSYLRHRSASSDGWHQLCLELRDEATGLHAEVALSSPDGVSAVRSEVTIVNESSEPVALTAVSSFAAGGLFAASAPVALLSADSEWLAEGRWSLRPLRPDARPDVSAELHGYEPRGRNAASSIGTWSTGERLPTAGLVDEDSGRTVAWQIEHNGPWHWEVGIRRDGAYVCLTGPTDADAQWLQRLAPGESFTTVPAAVVTTSAGGADAAFTVLTRYRRAIRRRHVDQQRLPVIFNDYMNTLMGDPTTEKLLPLIAAAGRVGAEVFVIDAGWYAEEAQWWDSVGEWQPSTTRFPGGIRSVLEAITTAGMGRGLWLEPEVVGVRSPVAQALPDDAFFARAGERLIEASRLHLDLSSPAARAHIDAAVDRAVDELGASYLKLDYNINPGPGTDSGTDSAGAGLLQHNRGHLSWLDSVLDRHPGLTLENCASGAMRMDYALMSRLQLQSTSDQQDPLRYPPIAASAPASLLPEQAASWAYPQPEMTDEEIAFTLCTGLAGRLYLSGRLDHMSEAQLSLVAEAVEYYKATREQLPESLPHWPLGLPGWADPWVALALATDRWTQLLLWARSDSDPEVVLQLPWLAGRQVAVQAGFPTGLPAWDWAWHPDTATLRVRSTVQPPSARILRLATT